MQSRPDHRDARNSAVGYLMSCKEELMEASHLAALRAASRVALSTAVVSCGGMTTDGLANEDDPSATGAGAAAAIERVTGSARAR
jgi:hypothetical protein